jgi:hypothetical protein
MMGSALGRDPRAARGGGAAASAVLQFPEPATATAGGIFSLVHWHLRQGFCACLEALGQATPHWQPQRRRRLAAQVESLLQACEMLSAVEQGLLGMLPGPADSSLANPDLLWGVKQVRRQLAGFTGAADPLVPQGQGALYRYLSLFVGELLVQMHAKEAEVLPAVELHLGRHALRKLAHELRGIAHGLEQAGQARGAGHE